MLDVFVRLGGFDARSNPRTGIGNKGRLLRTVADEDFLTERDRDSLPIFGDLFERSGAARAALARLDIPQVHGSIVVTRPHSYATPDRRECRLIEAIAPGLSEIMVQAVQLGSQHDRTTMLTAEALEGVVLLFDGDRRIVAMSATACAWRGTGHHWRTARR